MNTRQRFQAAMRFQPFDRLPAIESYWWWNQTLDRWYAEGLPRSLTEHSAIAHYLGLDRHHIFWISPRMCMAPPPERRRETGLVRNLAEYEDLCRNAYDTVVFDEPTVAGYFENQARGDAFVWLQVDGFFWFPRELLGIEPHFYAFYDQPMLLHRMNRDLAAHILLTLETLQRFGTPDVLTFAEDMSYNHGSMLSKAAFDEFLAPYYRQVIPAIERQGTLPFVDSDGNLHDMIPWLEQVGLVGASPLERRAGNDLTRIRAAHPQFRILGGYDKTVLHLGPAAMREEFERILPVMRAGGYVPSVDHQTPPDVSLTQYRQYVELLHEYCVKAATPQGAAAQGASRNTSDPART